MLSQESEVDDSEFAAELAEVAENNVSQTQSQTQGLSMQDDEEGNAGDDDDDGEPEVDEDDALALSDGGEDHDDLEAAEAGAKDDADDVVIVAGDEKQVIARPKRPQTAYFHFVARHRVAVKAANPGTRAPVWVL